ncbi:AfsA-related hotdog domain-containing protein [Gordonia jinhuaensis]
MPAEVWARIRHRGRNSLGLPDAHGIPDLVPVARMRPGAVGRHNPRNAILANPVHDAHGEISALTVIDTNHPSLFDHALDHVPGMLQFEAARQIAMAAANASLGLDTNRMVMHQLEIAFEDFGEFELETIARAVAEPDPKEDGAVIAVIRITQGDKAIASGRVHLRVMPVDIWTMVQ